MQIAVVGAGPSGLAAARAMRAFGQDVTVYEATDDIGGVWSRTRRYPGIATQNDKYTYVYSDLAMPDDCPHVPQGADVRAYLERFADVNDLHPCLRLSTRVSDIRRSESGWTFEAHGPDGVVRESADWVIVANGLHSKPYVPHIEGRDVFEAGGGLVVVPSQLGDAEHLHGKHVVVVGWGKSAGDIAFAIAGKAASVTVVARRIGWKIPRVLFGQPFERYMLSRLGEFAIWGGGRDLRRKIVRKLTQPARRLVVALLGRTVERTLELRRRGLYPDTAADQLDHLMTEGLLEAIDDGLIEVCRGNRIAELGTDPDSGGHARLQDGTTVKADVVVVATGYDADVSLFAPETLAELVDDEGDLPLLRYILPTRVSNLAFIGWVNSFRNPIAAETQSLWLAAMMFGGATLPKAALRLPRVYRLTHESAAARGVELMPDNVSFAAIDEWLADIDLTVSRWRRRHEILGPLLPALYADRMDLLQARIRANGGDVVAPAPRSSVGPSVA